MLASFILSCATILGAAETSGQAADIAANAPIAFAQHMACVPPDGFAAFAEGDNNDFQARGSEYGIVIYTYDPEGQPAPVIEGYRVPYLLRIGGFFLGGDTQIFWMHVREGYTLSFNAELSEAYTRSGSASVVYFDSFEEGCYPHCIKRQYLLEVGEDRRVKLNGVELFRVKEWRG